jgi:hypothetical protein
VQKHKEWSKRMCILAGEAKLRDTQQEAANTDSSKLIPLPAVRLLESGVTYQVDELAVLDQKELMPTFFVEFSTATSIVEKWASRYLEAAVVLKTRGFW